MSARVGLCDICGDEFELPATVGRPPVNCSACRKLTTYKRVVKLQARVAALQEQRHQLLAIDIDRLVLARAVRRVGHAEGRIALRDALADLRDIAGTWAHRLTDPGEEAEAA